MKHSTVCVCAGTLLIIAPMVLLAYQVHEVAAASQSFAVNHYGGSITLPPFGLAWKLVPWVVGTILVAFGIVIGALDFKRNKEGRASVIEVGG